MLSVLFLYSSMGALPRHSRRGLGGGLRHHALARLVPDHHRQRVGALGRRILRVSVVDVQPPPFGIDVGQAQVLVGELRGVRRLTGQVEAARASGAGLILSKSQRARRALAAVAA